MDWNVTHYVIAAGVLGAFILVSDYEFDRRLENHLALPSKYKRLLVTKS